MKINTKNLIIGSGVIGNFLEQFDIMICTFLAQTVASTFFPSSSPSTNLINTFYIFLAGYLARPIGSLLIGLFADHRGRKKALIFSIVAIGLGTTIIGLIPSYKELGILSTLFFIACRILQNLCAGGEYISSLVYLIESSSKSNRGFYGSWVALGVNCGTLAASILVFITTYYIDLKIIPEWSWRIIFFTAIVGMAFGLWIRYSLPESLEYILENSTLNKTNKLQILKTSLHLVSVWRNQCLSIVTIAWLGVAATIGFYVYAPIHLTDINHLSKHMAYGINSFSLLILIIFIPVFGIISDHFNKIKLLILSSFILIALSVPSFWYFSNGNAMVVLFFKCLISIPLSCYFCIAPVVISEIFPLNIRCTCIALIYQITASFSAGMTPIIMIYLVQYTTSLSPGYFLLISSVFTTIGLFYLIKNPILDYEAKMNLDFKPVKKMLNPTF